MIMAEVGYCNKCVVTKHTTKFYEDILVAKCDVHSAIIDTYRGVVYPVSRFPIDIPLRDEDCDRCKSRDPYLCWYEPEDSTVTICENCCSNKTYDSNGNRLSIPIN